MIHKSTVRRPEVKRSEPKDEGQAINLQELIRALDIYEVDGDMDIDVTSVEYNSRECLPGSVFVAIPGFKSDGATFAADAIARGAIAVVSESVNASKLNTVWVKVPTARQALSDLAAKLYGYPGKALKVCGVTGTNGKTTSAFILRRILEERGKKVGLISSLMYDTCGDVFPAERTTPESLDIQRLLFLMRHNGCNNVVMEVSSHALALKRVENIEFRVGLFTNLTRDHLDFHGDMKKYLEAKALLVDKLDGLTKYAVINLDEPHFRELFGRLKSAFLTFSLEDTAADVYTLARDLRPDGTIFDLVTPLGSRTVNMKLLGQFNLMNALGATAAGLASGVDLDSVVVGLEAVEPIPGRFQRIDHGQPFTVIVDYAHTPDAITRAIEAAKQITHGRVLTLFGCGGDRDRGKRPEMASAATSASDYSILTSDNPRTEDPLKIIEDIKPGLRGDAYEIEPNRRKALRLLLQQARAGDFVLALGKGAEKYEFVGAEKIPYSDIEEIQTILTEMGYASAVAVA